jgi:Na+/melibiose symporter-like transporter
MSTVWRQLAALGAVLFALRLIDVVQDPVLGWLAERTGGARAGRWWRGPWR